MYFPLRPRSVRIRRRKLRHMLIEQLETRQLLANDLTSLSMLGAHGEQQRDELGSQFFERFRASEEPFGLTLTGEGEVPNRAPVINNGAMITINPMTEDENQSTWDAGTGVVTVNQLLQSAGFSDADLVGAPYNSFDRGVAITSVSGRGRWEYQAAAYTWVSIPAVSEQNALLLTRYFDTGMYGVWSEAIRYVPDQKNGEVVQFTFRAWDMTTGTPSSATPSFGNASINGGSAAFSSGAATATLVVSSVNDAPTVDNVTFTMGSTDEDTVSSPISVASLLNSVHAADVDTGSVLGIGVWGVWGEGTWQYSTDAVNWTTLTGAIADQSLQILSGTSFVRYIPDFKNGEYAWYNNNLPTVGFNFHAWDATDGALPSLYQIPRYASTLGLGSPYFAYSQSMPSAMMVVRDVNDAPHISNGALYVVPETTEDNPTIQLSVLDIVRSANFSDVDRVTYSGMGITSVTGNGSWQYSTGDGIWVSMWSIGATIMLSDMTWIRYLPDGRNGEAPSFTYRAWDQSLGTPSTSSGLSVAVLPNGGTGTFSTEVATVTGSVTSWNDAPKITNGAVVTMTSTSEDVPSSPIQVRNILTAANWSDVDIGAQKGLAVYGPVGNGTWQYSTDQVTWSNYAGQALLLGENHWLRFNPDQRNGGGAQLRFRAWDRTDGYAAPSYVPGFSISSYSPTSTEEATLSISVTDVNDAPTIATGAVVAATTTEDFASNPISVASILSTSSWADIDNGALGGIAVTGRAGTASWQYSVDGSTWSSIASVSTTSALLLNATSLLRYLPNQVSGETATLNFKAWDQSTGSASTNVSPSYGNATLTGGTSAYSINSGSISLTVTNLNDAPTITNGTVVTFPTTNEDTPSSALSVNSILTSSNWGDVDAAALKGLAIIGKVGAGNWQFSTDGISWFNIGVVSSSSALLLSSSSQLRYMPSLANGETASFTYKAWDQTVGSPSSTGFQSFGNASTSGGTSAFSAGTGSASISVTNVNDAPIITGASVNMLPTNEDTISVPITVEAILTSSGWSDPDVGAAKGIAVISTASAGSWQYSTDGVSWTSVGAVSSGSALLLNSTSQLRYSPNLRNGETATLGFKAWDQTAGVASTNASRSYGSATLTGGSTAYSINTSTLAIVVTNVNDAPIINNGAVVALTTTNEDVPSTPTTVSSILASSGWSDFDPGALMGIAIVAKTGNANWQYSSDGFSWFNVGAVSSTSALLLNNSSQVRYSPNLISGENASFSFKAWDQTSGSSSSSGVPAYGNASLNGGTTAYSVGTASASIVVSSVNDAPTITSGSLVTIPAINEDSISTSVTVNQILDNSTWADVDAGALRGLALTGKTGAGLWQYSMDGLTWTPIGTLSTASALLLDANASLRYTGDQRNGEVATIVYKAWDKTTGTPSATALPSFGNASSPGGSTAFSTSNGTVSLTVTSVNDAPTITNGAVVTLTSTNEDAVSSATSVNTLLTSSLWSDVDTGAAKGIAVIAKVGAGNWQYSLDGASWTNIGSVSASSALLLSSITQLRYAPNLVNGESASLSFKAWDQTSGTASTNLAPAFGNASLAGGTTAYSVSTATASITVTSVNDAPTITNATQLVIPSTNEDTPSTILSVNSILTSSNWADVDASALKGLAIVSKFGSGNWQYSLDGLNWTNIGAVSSTSALLLSSTSQVRYFPNTLNAETASLTYKAWDLTTGAASNYGLPSFGNASTPGGSSAYSVGSGTVTISVTGLNDAPSISPSAVVTLLSTNEDSVSTATTVDSLLTSSSWYDPDVGALKGIAVVSKVGGGDWQFSVDGTTWTSIGNVSTTSALLLSNTSRLRYAPDLRNGETANITFKAWDQTAGSASANALPVYGNASVNGGITAYSIGTATATMTVISVNDAPTISSGASTAFSSTTSNQPSATRTVDSLLTSSTWADVDIGALKGVAVIAQTGGGTWQFSTDSFTWTSFGSVSGTTSLLLSSTTSIRYLPNLNIAENATFTFRAWDQTSGSPSNSFFPSYANTTINGGITAFSSATATGTISVGLPNRAPTLTPNAVVALTTTNEDTTSSASSVDSILLSSGWADQDAGALRGMAITARTGAGSWQYSTDGVNWTGFGTVTTGNALLLSAGSQVRYVPNLLNGETATFTFRAWDQTSGVASVNGAPSYANTSVNGGVSAFSSATASGSLIVTSVNDAPTITNGATYSFAGTNEDTTSSSALVTDLLSASSWADVDTGAVRGIAIKNVSGNGIWQYSANGGANWTNFGNVSASSALLLNANSQLRYVPDARNGETASLTFSAWDQTAGSASGVGTPQYGNASVNGGTTAYSTAAASGSILVTSVNDAPTILPNSTVNRSGTFEEVQATTTTVSTILTTSQWADVDIGALNGLAITGASGIGTWQYSPNGITWTNFGAVAGGTSLLLTANSKVRYVPVNRTGETATFSYRAWDQTTGIAFQYTSTAVNGGIQAYSASQGTFTQVVLPPPNSPPRFTSTPLTAATVGSEYKYESTATDPEGDSMTFALGNVVWPDGFVPSAEQQIHFEYVNVGVDQRGVFKWTPPLELAGKTILVEELVSDPGHPSISRTFQIIVGGVEGNRAPTIVSDPAEHYQLPVNITGNINPDPVAPEYISVSLASGQEVKVKISVSPTQDGAPTADVVFLVDTSGSMGDAIGWLGGVIGYGESTEGEPQLFNVANASLIQVGMTAVGEGIPANTTVTAVYGSTVILSNPISVSNFYLRVAFGSGVIEEIETRLHDYGIVNNRYGLTLFSYISSMPFYDMAIPVGKVDVANPPIQVTELGYATTPDELWGDALKLKLAMQSVIAYVPFGGEVGHLAMQRVLSDSPGFIEGSIPPAARMRYDFRGDATISLLMITDDDAKSYNKDLHQQLATEIVGVPDDYTDDILFSVVGWDRLMVDDQNGNVDSAPFVSVSPGWVAQDEGLAFTTTTSVPGGYALFDVGGYDHFYEDAALFANNFRNLTFRGRAAILPGGEERVRIVMDQAMNFGQGFYLEGSAETNQWVVKSNVGAPSTQLTLGAGKAWPDIKTGEYFDIEVRLLSGAPDRLDLFINGQYIASALYTHYLFGNGNTRHVGFGAVNSSIIVDRWDVGRFIDPNYNLDFDMASLIQPDEPSYDPTNLDRLFIAEKLAAQDHGLKDGASYSPNVLGIDYVGDTVTGYLLDGSSMLIRQNGQVMAGIFNQESHYYDMASSVNGSLWNLGALRGDVPLSNLSNFTEAFSESFAKDILTHAISVVTQSEILTHVEPSFDFSRPEDVSFIVTLTGAGDSEQFDLEFVRKRGTTQTVLGTIPVWVTAPYSHIFEVEDFENDEPYTIQFDPDYVDANGQVITHGAVLQDSGRSTITNDRLVWVPHSVSVPTDFLFRVVAIDSAGQRGYKQWTVRVYPASPFNNPPVIDVSGLERDSNNSNGFINEPKLPAAQELRGYRYQVLATDVDAQDQGNLRYYLVPTTKSDGTKIPVPKWLKIDRNTGILSGRPGSADLGSTHVTVQVADGRLRVDGNGEIVTSRASQVFLLEVKPREHINAPPVIVPIDDFSTRAGVDLKVQVQASDADNDELTFSLAKSPDGMVIDSLTGTIHWVPSVLDTEKVFPILISVSDGTTSSTEQFTLHVGHPNRPPQILSELPDGVMFVDYIQPLDVVDPDGDLATISVVGMEGMEPTIVDGKVGIAWAKADIIPGTHRIDVTAFDKAGGVANKTFYVKFANLFTPQIVSLTQPTWRVGQSATAELIFDFPLPLPNPMTSEVIALDANAIRNGISIDYANAHKPDPQDHPYRYQVPIKWTPRFEGPVSFNYTLFPNLGIEEVKVKNEVSFLANPFVIQAENDKPVFDGSVLGPFEKDTLSAVKLNVSDPEGQALNLQIVNSTFGIQAQISGQHLVVAANRPGIHRVTVRATEAVQEKITNANAKHPVPIDDNATGTGWLMYSSQAISDRFRLTGRRTGASENFIAVRYQLNQWQYNDDSGWVSFTPRSDDLLVASVDYSSDVITSLNGSTGRVNGMAFGSVSSNLTFQINQWDGVADPGEITVVGMGQFGPAPISMTMTTQNVVTQTYSVAVVDNAAPAAIYHQIEAARLGSDYSQVFNIADPNPGDTFRVELNAAARAAGLSVAANPQVSGEYLLTWSATDIATWAAGKSYPLSIPVALEVIDIRGESSQLSFDLPIRNRALLPEFVLEREVRISANKTWQDQVQYQNPGGYEIIFDIEESPYNPPDMTISTQDGVLKWLPSVELLVDAQGVRHDERTFEFFVAANVVDEEMVFVRYLVTIVDPAVFDPYIPEVDSVAAPPPTAASINQPLVYQPKLKAITNPDHAGAIAKWSLEESPSGMTIDASTGKVSWTPSGDLAGKTVPVTIRVASDQGSGTVFKFNLKINTVNIAPMFTSTFPTIWESMTPVSFPVLAADPEGHALEFEFKPVGASQAVGLVAERTSPSGWQITWNSPTPGQYQFEARVFEKHNPAYQEIRTVTLAIKDTATYGRVNLEPLILGLPHVAYVAAGTQFTYTFGVADKDQPVNQPFQFSLVDGGSATVDNTGKFSWTAPQGVTGTKSFKLAVKDKSPHVGVPDNTRYLTFQLFAIDNAAPVIVAPSVENLTNVFSVEIDTEFVYQVKATDQEDHGLTYSLEGAVPEGMRIDANTGELRWFVQQVPPNNVANLFVRVTDEFNGSSRIPLTFNVSLVDRTAPAVTFYLKTADGEIIPPNSEILAENFHDYDIWLDVQDNRGTYLPDESQNGSWHINVKNTPGNEAQNVSAGVLWSQYSINPSNAPRHGLWKVDFVGQGLNQGILEISIEAYDKVGNISRRYARFYVNDLASANIGKLLNIQQDSPAITDRFEVIGNAFYHDNDGYGSYDLKLTSMDDPTDFVYLARNQPAIVSESVVGIVDGTQLPTGQYRLYLEVRQCQSCIVAVDERIIEVQNVSRLGNFDLAFSDLNVALGGVPVPLIRTYSSGLVGETDNEGKGSFTGDFSPGWNLNILQSKVSVSHPKGTTTSLDEAFAKGTRVFVTLPSGQVQRFTFAPIPVGNDVFQPALIPDPEFKSDLHLKGVDANLRFVLNKERNDGTYIAANSSEVSIPSNFGSAWILKTQDGLEYEFDIATGLLRSISSSSGARLDIEEQSNGDVVLSARNTGDANEDGQPQSKTVVIHRDLIPGSAGGKPHYRVKAIDDADTQATRQILYSYGQYSSSSGQVTSDTQQNLAQVQLVDQQKSSYTYADPNLPRHVTEVYDNANKLVLSASYFSNLDGQAGVSAADRADERFGRLKSTSSSNGVPTSFTFDFDLGNGKKVRVTNTSGSTIEQVVDSRGKTIRNVALVSDAANDADKRYMVSVTRYNLRGLVVAQSRPFYVLGAANRFIQEPVDIATDPFAWSATFTYDVQDRKLTERRPDGGQLTYTYDDAQGIQTTTDAHGVTSVRRADPASGRLLETYSLASGSQERKDWITYEYDSYGNVVAQYLNLPGGVRQLTDASSYNSDGFLQWTEKVGSLRQYYAYDANGQQILSWQNVPSPTNPGQFTTQVTVKFNDFAGPGNPNSTRYGLETAQFEIVGTSPFDESATSIEDLKTKLTNGTAKQTGEASSIKNSRGLVVESRTLSVDSQGTPFWYLTQTVYDSAGRVEYQTDSYRENTAVNEIQGTRTYYDDKGRAWKTETRRGIGIVVSNPTLGAGESSYLSASPFGDAATLISYSTTDFDTLGRVYLTTQYSTNDPNSYLTSTSIYNLKGQVTETRQQAWNGAGTGRVNFITRTVYDDRDRVVLQTDSYLEGSREIFGTQTIYDSADRPATTVRRRGVSVAIDGSGATSIVQLGQEQFRTTGFYDIDRQVRSIDALGGVSDSEYDQFGRQTASIGPRTSVDGRMVRSRVETLFDAQGRVKSTRSGIIQDESGRGQHDFSQAITTEYAYDEANRVYRTTYTDGSFAEVRFDALGRKIAESKPVVAGTQLTWYPTERTFKDAQNNVVPTRTSEYDTQGRLMAVELPAVVNPVNGALVRPRYQYGYDVSGQQNLIQDPYNRQTRFTFDASGRQLTRTLPLGFGTDGIQGTSDDASATSFSESFAYDSRGRQHLHTTFEGIVERRIYDDRTGRLLELRFYSSTSDFTNGIVKESQKFSYDDFGRNFKTEIFVNGVLSRLETTAYDEQGRIKTTTNPEGRIDYQYDVHGRLSRKEWTSRAYTLQGQSYENATDYSYDELGRLKTVSQSARAGATLGTADKTGYTYNLNGNLDRMTYQDGVIHDYEYDLLGRLTSIDQWVDLNHDGSTQDIERRAAFDYTVRVDGKRTHASEKFYSDQGYEIGSNTFDWSYDAVDRLVAEVSNVSYQYTNEQFVYDLAGNRVSRSKQQYGSPQTTTYHYDANDRLLSSTQTGGSEAGETNYEYVKTQQSKKIFGSKTTEYSYNVHGQLSEVRTTNYGTQTKTTYGYDSTGTRVWSEYFDTGTNDGYYGLDPDGPTEPQLTLRNRTEYLTDSENPTGYSQVLEETQFSSTGQITKRIVYTVGHDQITQTVQEQVPGVPNQLSAPTTHYFGADGHGSVRVLFDAVGAIVGGDYTQYQIYNYDAYGNLLGWTYAQPLTNYLYSGESFDFNIGQQYLRARFYDATTGRFTGLDPFAGNSSDPQSYHKYAYVHGDPIQGVDPTGMFSMMTLVIGGGIFGATVGGIHGAIKGYRHGLVDAVFGGLEGAIGGAAYGMLGGLLMGYGGVGLAFAARALGFYLLPSAGIAMVGGFSALLGIGGGIAEYREANDANDRLAAMVTVFASFVGLTASLRVGLPETWIPWNIKTQYRGTTYYEAVETVENQSLNLSRIAARQVNAKLDFGPGIYTTNSVQTAAYFATQHGVSGRQGGPAILVVKMSRGQWWWLKYRYGALEDVPISNEPGLQNFVPPEGAESLNSYAVFFMREMHYDNGVWTVGD